MDSGYEVREPVAIRRRNDFSVPDERYVSSRGQADLPRHNYSLPPLRSVRNFDNNGWIKRLATFVGFNKPTQPEKRKLALLLPGHNEELIIQTTIQTAINAGMDKADIYVVDDASTDATWFQAVAMLGESNVLTVERSGKAKAIYHAIKHFDFEKRYQWLHVSDADSVFGENYFNIYRAALKEGKYVAAVGFVQSLRGNWIANYRAFSYTYGQQVIRRWQSWFGMIAVLPGPTTCFRTDILSKLDFLTGTITEDFDLTLQIHRKKLGRIMFITQAVNYTQDPQTLRDFCKQTLRWQRGFFQCIRNYKIGQRLQLIDLSIGYVLFQFLTYVIEMGIVVPYLIYKTGRWEILLGVLAADFLVVSVLAIFSSTVTKRLSILKALPYYYFLRWVEMGIFIWAFIEIIILKRFKSHTVGWGTEGRRFALDANALKDVAI
ncbi:MAG TPA: glycosyltransferase family 2 protein [Candidatus Saccharimonadales bacterium]|nr:glycosyltransferase family 2 protein [Candidatus Saccharimonadales bacterium]